MSNLPDRFKGREEKTRLKELESIVEKRMVAVKEAADALWEISESKLYRLEYRSFDEYCKARWGFGGRNGYLLINKRQEESQDAQTISHQATSEGGDNPTPLCPACIGEKDRCDACKPLWEEWANVERIKAKYQVPKYLVPAFAEGEAVSKAAKQIKSAADALEKMLPGVHSKLYAIIRGLKDIPSEACGCSQDADCDECKGKGWLNATQAQRRKERVNF